MSSAETAAGAGRVEVIPLASIVQGEQLLRALPNDDAVIELAASIAQVGLLQPIGVARVEGDRYQLLWGDRRRLAHLRLGRTHIAARVVDVGAGDVKLLALTENLQRLDLSLMEECDAVTHLHEREGLSPDQIATRLGRSRGWVLTRLAIPNFPGDVRGAVLDGVLALGSGEEIAAIEDDAARAYILNQCVQSRLTGRQVSALVRLYRETPSLQPAVEAAVEAATAPGTTVVVLLTCSACGRTRRGEELALVRVCGDGCGAAPADSPPAPRGANGGEDAD